MALYTPFFERAAANVMQGKRQGEINQIAQRAYLGDQEAMSQLYGVAPEVAGQIERTGMQKQQIEGQRMAAQAAMQKEANRAAEEEQKRQREFGERIAPLAANFETVDEFNQFMQAEAQRAGIEMPPVPEEAFGQLKQAFPAKQEDPQKQINVLRSDIQDITKTFREVEESYNRIVEVADDASAAGDLALIFNFMKMLDPGSTVREGEFATAQNTAGVPGRVVSLYNNILEGTRLNEDQRKDFLSQTKNLFNAQRLATDEQIGNILQLADQDKIDRVKVMGKERLDKYNARIGERALRPSVQEALDEARARGDI